jgi:Formate hydrogenlyase subunit 3/Multisubunit Na+/H+ antiporter, MnhD subunit
MANELMVLALIAWVLGLALALIGRGRVTARLLLALGAVLAIGGVVAARLVPTPPMELPFTLAGAPLRFALDGAAQWLFGFGLLPALFALLLGTPQRDRWRGWLAGAAVSLIGAYGVFASSDGIAFLVAWELLSLGGAMLLLAERPAESSSQGVLFMLALLEVGSVAVMAAYLLLGHAAGTMDTGAFAAAARHLSPLADWLVGLLLLIGFGAKLGVLPFYEWLPEAYGTGSGASGALLSGVILNAAFYALGHALTAWLSGSGAAFGLGALLVITGVFSAILTILYAFQEEDWRKLLSLSSAENASIAVTALGASLIFIADGQAELAALAWLVGLLHLAQHPLAKGALFLGSDGSFHATGDYRLLQRGVLRRAAWPFGVGAVLAGMSLAAMPPVAGFASEWYVFQTLFQSFHLHDLSGRLILSLAGAGLAITAAVAFATFIKLLGIGLGGDGVATGSRPVPRGHALAVGVLGFAVLALAFALPWLLPMLGHAGAVYDAAAAASMRDGHIVVPLSAGFAFISPTKLIIVGPLLALLPGGMLLLARARRVRRAPVWYGGLARGDRREATTALTFSNAMRTFYSFIYRPSLRLRQEHSGDGEQGYFVRRLSFTPDVAPLFGQTLFQPAVRLVEYLARAMRPLQSGSLNVYLAFPGVALVLILLVATLT